MLHGRSRWRLHGHVPERGAIKGSTPSLPPGQSTWSAANTIAANARDMGAEGQNHCQLVAGAARQFASRAGFTRRLMHGPSWPCAGPLPALHRPARRSSVQKRSRSVDRPWKGSRTRGFRGPEETTVWRGRLPHHSQTYRRFGGLGCGGLAGTLCAAKHQGLIGACVGPGCFVRSSSGPSRRRADQRFLAAALADLAALVALVVTAARLASATSDACLTAFCTDSKALLAAATALFITATADSEPAGAFLAALSTRAAN